MYSYASLKCLFSFWLSSILTMHTFPRLLLLCILNSVEALWCWDVKNISTTSSNAAVCQVLCMAVNAVWILGWVLWSHSR